ncbi:MAG: TRAFAC clade GTPase domain-containing protein [Bacillota bacterium]
MKMNYICPYCFSKHKIHEVKFRCSNENHKEQDEVFGNYWGYPTAPFDQIVLPAPERGKWAKLKPSMPESTTCEECDTNPVTRIRICPTCHSTLPSTIADYEDYIIAVIGGKETGKSHYIAMLIERINNEVGNAYNCFLQPENDETIQRYKESFYNPLFKDKRTLNVTDSANANDEVKRPLLYTLSINGEGMLGKKMITLAFFDTAGEDLNDEKNMMKHNRYICNSSGVICLLDPLQLDSVRKEINESELRVSLPQDNPNADVSDILARTTNMIRNTLNIKKSKKIRIPMALSFSKIDAIQPLLDPSSQLNQKSQHIETNGFDVVDYENVNKEMEGLVQEWTRGNIPMLLDHNYKEFAYFGVSALGHDPGAGMEIKELNPYRVEDPFLWLLWKNNIIKGINRK